MKKIILIVLILTGVVLGFIFRDSIDLLAIKQYILSYGWLAPVVFILLYICFTILMLPGAFLTGIGGAIFGYWGILINIIAASLGATVAFIISKYISGNWVKEHIVNHANESDKAKNSKKSKVSKKLARIMRVVNSDGWRIVALLRLIPLVPFNILNYVLGLTTISLGVYIITSVIFMLPGTIVYTYLGILGDVALQGDKTALLRGTALALSLFVGLFLLTKIVKSWRKQDVEKLSLDN